MRLPSPLSDPLPQAVLKDLIAALYEEGDKEWREAGVSQEQCYYGGGDGTNIEAKVVHTGVIQKFETTAKQILVYVANISPDESVVLTYQLHAKYPLKVQAPDSSASLYYDLDLKTTAPGGPIEVQ